MNISLVTIGSTGDVRPYIVLGKELQRRGHHVKIAAFEKFRDVALSSGFDFFPIAGDAMQFIDDLMKPGTKGIGYLCQVVKTLKGIIPEILADLEKSCADADAMFCTFFGSMYYSVAEKYNIPCVQTEYFPIDSHPLVPMSSAPGQHLGKCWNLLTYRIGHLLISILEKIYLAKWRKSMSVSSGKISTKPQYCVNGHIIPVIYAMSPEVFPRSPYWSEHIYLSGFWYDEKKPDYNPPEALEEFISAGEKPIYIGFGSMVSGDMKKTFETVMSAVKKAGVRAIVDGGWAKENISETDDRNVYILTDYVPHDWLFPQMQAAVHHGGAGTTATALRAGIPMLIVPFGGDQPFWGNRIYACGCGPKPIIREHLTSDNMAKAICDLTTDKRYAENAKALAEKISKENGTANAADIAEREIENWKAQKNGKYMDR